MLKRTKKTGREQTHLARLSKDVSVAEDRCAIAQLMSQGCSDGEIADALSTPTKNITKNAIKKRRQRMGARRRYW
jgi:hypothetical protein